MGGASLLKRREQKGIDYAKYKVSQKGYAWKRQKARLQSEDQGEI